MRKKKYIIASLLVSSLLCFAGCGDSDEKSTETTTTNQEQSTPMEATTPEETTTEEQSSEELTSSSYEGNYSEYPTEIVEYGCGTRLTADGRNEGAVYCDNMHGDYQVDFYKGTEKTIYLTFDEGYENGYTPAILDTLREKNVKAVFFCTMDFVVAEPELVQRIIDEGHVLANHSVRHKSIPSLSVEEQKNEILQLHEYVRENFGYEMYLFRPPMGHYSEQSLAVTGDIGYTSVLWSFAYYDYDVENQPSHEDALQTMTDRLHVGAIYLLHAVSEANTAVLGDFIDAARAEGYEFLYYEKEN